MGTPLPSDWEQQILKDLGAPVTPNNLASLKAWQQAEGGSTNNPDAYNPFNTTRSAPGSHPTNSVGVQAFPNWSSGLNATVATIEQQNMAGILAALEQNASPADFERAVNSSPWGTHFSNVGTTAPWKGQTPAPSSTAPIGAYGAGWEGATGLGAISIPWSQVPQSAASALLKTLLDSGAIMRGFLVVVGVIIVMIGLSQIDKVDGAGGTAKSGVQSVNVTLRKAGSTAAKAVAA